MQRDQFNSRIPKSIKEKLLAVSYRTGIDISLIAKVGIDRFLALEPAEQNRRAAEHNPKRRGARQMAQINTRWDEEFMVNLAKKAGMVGLSQVIVIGVGITEILELDDTNLMAAVREWLLKNEVPA